MSTTQSTALSRRRPLRRALLGTSEGRIGTVLLLCVLVLVVIGTLLAPATEPGDAIPAQFPSPDHLFGTDALGRDVAARLAAGGGSVLLLPLVATTIALLLGAGLGLLAGAVGGITDLILSKIFDLMLTVPSILIVMFVVSLLGTSDLVLVLTVAAVYTPQFGRVVRSVTQTAMTNLYVDAARSRGERLGAIIIREIVPNTYAPVIANYALNMTYAILFVAGLSFLGLGVQPPAPDWGLMVSENRSIMAVNPFAPLAPAAAITALAVSINLIADALTAELTRTSSDRMAAL